MAPGAKARRHHLSRWGHGLGTGSLTPGVIGGDFLPPCLHRDATGAVHSQSWKLQQPVSRHYNNLHTSGYETEHSEKVLYWSLKSQRCGRVWEFLSFSVAPGLPLVCRHSVLPWGGASPLRAAW